MHLISNRSLSYVKWHEDEFFSLLLHLDFFFSCFFFEFGLYVGWYLCWCFYWNVKHVSSWNKRPNASLFFILFVFSSVHFPLAIFFILFTSPFASHFLPMRDSILFELFYGLFCSRFATFFHFSLHIGCASFFYRYARSRSESSAQVLVKNVSFVYGYHIVMHIVYGLALHFFFLFLSHCSHTLTFRANTSEMHEDHSPLI